MTPDAGAPATRPSPPDGRRLDPGWLLLTNGHATPAYACVFDDWGNAILRNTFGHNGSFGNETNGDFGEVTLTAAPSNCFHENVEEGGGQVTSSPPDLEQLKPTCGGTVPPDPNPTMTNQVVCDSQFFASLVGTATPCVGGTYPTRKEVIMHPLPTSSLPTMPDPCANVPTNPWCGSEASAIPASEAPSARSSVEASSLACTGAQAVLVDVREVAGRVLVTGVARPQLAGAKVRIVLLADHHTVVSTKVRRGGAFSAYAPLPPRAVRDSHSARYEAIVGSFRTRAINLARRMYLTRIVPSSIRRVSLAGYVTGQFRPGKTVTISLRTVCGHYRRVATARLRRNGHWRASAPAVCGGKFGVYRATTTVLSGNRLMQTSTLALAG